MSKKRIVGIILGSFFALAIVGVVVAYFVLSTVYPMRVPVRPANNDYTIEVVDMGGYTTLVKKNSYGEVCDEPIKVMAFTDTHLDAKKEKSTVSFNCIIKNIELEEPDLVVFVGDNITAGFNRLRTKEFVTTMETLNVYWAAVLGNHEGDNIWSMTRSDMMKAFAKGEHCLVDPSVKYTKDGGEVFGVGNYVINFADSKGNIYQSLFFVDGGSYMTEEDLVKYDAEFEDKDHNDYDYVKASQIQWYMETVEGIEALNGGKVNSVVFDHIPLPEYEVAYNEATNETEAVTEKPDCYGVVNENGTVLLDGQRREKICYSGHNSGFFDAILNEGSTKLFVAGHDHINDFVVEYKGVKLMYCVPGGYSSYNLYTKGISNKLLRGYSRFTFTIDGEVQIEAVRNADLYPDEQAEILKLY